MMEYAQYQQHQPSQSAHQPSHIQTGYPTSAGGSSIASPSPQHISQHGVQTSPVVPANQHQPSPTQNMYQSQYGVPQQNLHYGMPQIQAAAMAATAAASGSTYPYMPDPNIQQSPTMGLKRSPGTGPRSPQQLNSMAPQQRRMSQVSSPGLPQQPALLNHNGQRPGTVPPQMTAAQQMPPPQSPEVASGQPEESPLYVNAKQFHRILKRRVARQRLEEALRLTNKGRKPYLHESRHNHAMRRPRGPGGRFLTAAEVAAMEKKSAAEAGGGLESPTEEAASTTPPAAPAALAASAAPAAPATKKRKAAPVASRSAKRSKTSQAAKATEGEDADED